MLRNFIITIFSSFLLLTNVNAEKITVFDFTDDEFKTIKVKKVKGETTWTLDKNEKGNFIKAEADGKGSGLGKEVFIDLSKTPFINITWKVEKEFSSDESQQIREVNSSISKNLPLGTFDNILATCSFDI